MKIINWEKKFLKKYNAKKIDNFNDLKNYLTDIRNYQKCFAPEIITETEIKNDEFYAAYVFDESNIANRQVVSPNNSGWITTIIFLASKDKINISNMFMHQSNGLTDKERHKFYKVIYTKRKFKNPYK